ncbi:MAG TPA: glycerophosphodiester phosphodiesterase family protein [Gammaproteobacteria bacterium]|jgi:glycerophosphoryl diester phosphodiesterase|nr:glycerophosphodiester phosphodiesterase family protein [Gammaproteobacteria bacterium]
MTAKTVPTLVAHRGYPSKYPENTLLGIQAAVAAGAHWFEFDVQLSRDHVPYLCHDDSLERTAGLARTIMELSAAELAKVDVGYASRFGDRYRGTPPTPLKELVAWLGSQRQVQAFVEIKAESLEHFGHETVVGRVMDAIRPVLGQSVVISFDALCLKLARQRGAGPVGWALEDAGAETVKTATAFKPEYLFASTRSFTEAYAALKGPWQWAVYQVQDPAQAVALTEQGADMVETDAIGEMLDALR